MKYVTSQVVQPKVVKPFEFASAMESFSQSLGELYASYDAVAAAEGRVVEMEECLRDCSDALESIKAHGVNRISMGVLNRDGKLDEALGLESLNLEALESLSDASLKLLQTKYTAGLEDLQSENQKTFIAKVKDFIVKLWTWIKAWFVNDAKSIELVKNCKFEGVLDTSATITGVSKAKALTIVEELKTMGKTIINGENGEVLLEKLEDPQGTASVTDYERGTIQELGWDISGATGIKTHLTSMINTRVAFKQAIDATVRDRIQRNLDSVSAGKEWEDVKKLVSDAMHDSMIRNNLLKVYRRKYNELVMTLIAIDKNCKPAA